MDSAFIRALQQTKDPLDKTALIADTSLKTFPNKLAFIARQCVLFHWFDQSIIEALELALHLEEEPAQDVYRKILSLPFIERLPWGAAYQDLTRQGLLRRLAHLQPTLLKSAAQIAAPLYKASANNLKYAAAEALFCSIVSGEAPASHLQLDFLLEQAMGRQDWQSMEGLFRLQEEAEQLPFVEPIPRTERYWMLRSIVNRVQGKLVQALFDYDHVLAINSENALAYLNRSVVQLQLHHYEQAEADYYQALQLDPILAQTYISSGALPFHQKPVESNISMIDAQKMASPLSSVGENKSPIQKNRTEKQLIAAIGEGRNLPGKETKIQRIKNFFATLWDLLTSWMRNFWEASGTIPSFLGKFAKEALIDLKTASRESIMAAKNAWRELRKYLLKQTINILRLGYGSWTYQITTWYSSPEETNKVTRIVESCDIPWEELPDDVKEELIRIGEIEEVDFTKIRDFEMLAA